MKRRMRVTGGQEVVVIAGEVLLPGRFDGARARRHAVREIPSIVVGYAIRRGRRRAR